jgi:hypothetical protein
MDQFIARHREQIVGALSGFDRVVFRGTLRSIAYPEGMRRYLRVTHVLLKDFGRHVAEVSEQLKEASIAQAQASGRPVKYLPSSQTDKDALARRIMAADGITRGLVAVLSCVEPCQSFEMRRDRDTHRLVVEARYRKCLFLYHYWVHPILGFMNARIQTWFPFAIQVCLNGREWLAQQLGAAGLQYVRQDNCFPWVEDWATAQRLLDRQVKAHWPRLLDGIARQLNPIHTALFWAYPLHYYWSTYQSEWATDLVFRDGATLRRLYPRLLHHAVTTFGSADVMRFLGRRLPLNGTVPTRFAGEAVSGLKQREEGIRIKHSVNGNAVKLYDKAYTPVGNVLRAEATLTNVADIRVYRPKEGNPDGELAWRAMRRGIADLHRRTEVSQKATERYLDALASVDDDTTLDELLGRLGQPTHWHGRRVRAFRPFDAHDRSLLAAVSRGEFTLNGFRNRDLQRLFFTRPTTTLSEGRRRSAWVSRQLRLLRAHGLIRKIPGTHRYHVTTSGRKAITALLTALRSTVQQLTPVAA